jgi:mRNA interferase MazF
MVGTQDAVHRDDIWWADLGEPRGSGPGLYKPILVVQSNLYNRSRLNTVIAILLTTNTDLASAPGNVFVPARSSGLPRDSVANVTQLLTIDREYLIERAGKLAPQLREAVNEGLRRVLGL